MKTRIRNIFTLVIFMLLSVAIFAQVVEQPPTSFDYLGLVLGLGQYIFIGMLLTAVNHIVAFTFDIKLWLGNTFLPAVYAYVASLVLAAIDIWLPQFDFLVTAVVGQEVDTSDYGNLAVVGIVLVGVIKGYLERKKTQAKVEAAK